MRRFLIVNLAVCASVLVANCVLYLGRINPGGMLIHYYFPISMLLLLLELPVGASSLAILLIRRDYGSVKFAAVTLALAVIGLPGSYFLFYIAHAS